MLVKENIAKKYIAKNKKIGNTYLGKYLSTISELREEVNINSIEDIDFLIIDLEQLSNEISDFSETLKSNFIKKLFEKRMQYLDDTIDEVRIIEYDYNNEETELEEIEEDKYDEEYANLLERTRDDILDCLACLN